MKVLALLPARGAAAGGQVTSSWVQKLSSLGAPRGRSLHPGFSAYLKHRAGWTESLTRITPGRSVTLSAGRNEFALFEKSPTEYFILEARLQEGRDTALPDAGLAIWHVDEDGSNENEQRTPDLHYECSLEQADGRFDLENADDAGDRDDLFPFGGNDRFGNATSPDSRWWDGSSSGLEIRNIRRTGNAMTFVSE